MPTKKRFFASLKYILFTLASIGVATGLSFGLDALGIAPDAILLVYLLPILAIAVVCPSFVYSLTACILIILLFNFCFTAPRYSFAIDNPELYISLAMYLLVSILLFAETRGARYEIKRRKENEKRLHALSEFSTFLLEERTEKDIIEDLAKTLNSYFGFLIDVIEKEELPSFIEQNSCPKDLAEALTYSFSEGLPSGDGESHGYSLSYHIVPVVGESKTYALIVFRWTSKKKMNELDVSFIASLAALASNALTKKEALDESEKSHLLAESERFKTTMLRSLSHDIKTPLTALETGASLLATSYDELSESDRLGIAKNLAEETHSLSGYVENLLSLSKLSLLQNQIPKSYELAIDLWDEAYQREKSLVGKHKVRFDYEDDILVNCNGRLIVQVLENLLRNAFTHTKEDCEVQLMMAFEEGRALFRVSDTGGGLDPKEIPFLFSELSSYPKNQSDRYKGHGLGLSICQSIVKAHNGEITGYNNEKGGANFDVYLPLAKKGEPLHG